MCHFKCLEALAVLGASDSSIDWVATFLYGRTMSVKVGKDYSVPKHVPGGSPQGSILGNFLFCATTNSFAELEQPNIQMDYESDTSDTSCEDLNEVCSTPMAGIRAGRPPNWRYR